MYWHTFWTGNSEMFNIRLFHISFYRKKNETFGCSHFVVFSCFSFSITILWHHANSKHEWNNNERNDTACKYGGEHWSADLHFRSIMQNVNNFEQLSYFHKEIKNAPSALLSYISTREFLRTRQKCGEARAEGECFSHFSSVLKNSQVLI